MTSRLLAILQVNIPIRGVALPPVRARPGLTIRA